MFKKYALMFLVSMVPLIELRGSIPIGLGMGLNPLWLYIICIVGNMLPVPFIFFFARKVLVWGSDKKFIGKFFKFCLEKGEKGGKKLEAKANENLQAKSLKTFVQKYSTKMNVRTSMSNYRKEEWLINVPLYSVGNIKEIVNM